ncbi:MAG: hypothetical protein KDC80_24425 [Saprospiraceae bacterium]|nr:hypothetical protein [Saprospiraceae bacterium]
MKTIRLLAGTLCLALLSMSSNVYANGGDDPETISNLRSNIVKLVDAPRLGENGINKAEVKLRFYINKDHEIVVVDTGTQNNYLDSFLKNRLNYQRIKDKNLKSGIYNLKITFQSES